jgi:acid phosphatase (class A)
VSSFLIRQSLSLLLLSLLPAALPGQPLQAQPSQPVAAGSPAGGEAPVPSRSTSPSEGLVLDLDPLQRITGLPPQPGSLLLHDDLAILRWLQTNRTPQMVASTWMTLGRDPAVFSPALGVDMTKTTPRIAGSLQQFLALVDEACNQIKRRIQRPRPYVSHPDLRPCLPPESGYSFPSGHSSWYTAAAQLLADLVPERRTRLEEMGNHGAANRVMCGVHYPSDTQAAQRFGRAAADQIIASSQWQRFRRDPAIQAEIQRVRQARPEALPLLVR